MQFSTRLQRTPSLIDLTPLVDVIFLLLIFFIVTSDILPFKSLPIENPTLAQTAAPLTTQLLVVMDAEQVVYVGSKKRIVAPDEVNQSLKKEVEQLLRVYPNAAPTIVLSLDRSLSYDHFLHLFSQAQELGYPLRLVFKEEEERC